MELEPQWKPTLQPPRFTSDLEQTGTLETGSKKLQLEVDHSISSFNAKRSYTKLALTKAFHRAKHQR